LILLWDWNESDILRPPVWHPCPHSGAEGFVAFRNLVLTYGGRIPFRGRMRPLRKAQYSLPAGGRARESVFQSKFRIHQQVRDLPS
jgi:hypothetical protein